MAHEYASVEELQAYVATGRAEDASLLGSCLTAASRQVDALCGRRFWADTTATARVLSVLVPGLVDLPDVHTSTGLIVETDYGARTWTTVLVSTQYELRPVGGVTSTGELSPFTELWAIGPEGYFPESPGSVRVTAKWGWAAVPDAVKQATLMLAQEMFRMKDAVFGVAGISALDGQVFRVRENPYVVSLLAPYRRSLLVA